MTLAAALAAAPLAVAWGVGHAQVEDYLGPAPGHVRQQLLRRAGDRPRSDRQRLPAQPDRPARRRGHRPRDRRAGRAGRRAAVGADPGRVHEPLHRPRPGSPRASWSGCGRAPWSRAPRPRPCCCWASSSSGSGTAGWRRPWLGRLTTRRAFLAYATALVLVVGSVVVPNPRPGLRIPVDRGRERPAVRLADRGQRAAGRPAGPGDQGDPAARRPAAAGGRRLRRHRLAQPQHASSLALPAPRRGETMLLGLSDLHCNQATTELITRLVAVTDPALVISAGDDTVNGTAAERGCITREAAIAGGRPFLVATGQPRLRPDRAADGPGADDRAGRRPGGGGRDHRARRRRPRAQHPVQRGAGPRPGRDRGGDGRSGWSTSRGRGGPTSSWCTSPPPRRW